MRAFELVVNYTPLYNADWSSFAALEKALNAPDSGILVGHLTYKYEEGKEYYTVPKKYNRKLTEENTVGGIELFELDSETKTASIIIGFMEYTVIDYDRYVEALKLVGQDVANERGTLWILELGKSLEGTISKEQKDIEI